MKRDCFHSAFPGMTKRVYICYRLLAFFLLFSPFLLPSFLLLSNHSFLFSFPLFLLPSLPIIARKMLKSCWNKNLTKVSSEKEKVCKALNLVIGMTCNTHQPTLVAIDPIHKGVSLFLSYTNMNKMNSLHHMKQHPKISNFLQFESFLPKNQSCKLEKLESRLVRPGKRFQASQLT